MSRGVAMVAPVSRDLPQSMLPTSSCSWTATIATVLRRCRVCWSRCAMALRISSSARAWRESGSAGAMPWHAVIGNRLAARLIAFLSGVRLTDLGPFRAARYQALIALGLRESTYGWPVEMIVKGCAARTPDYRSAGELSSSDRLIKDKRHLPRQYRRGLGYPQRYLEVSVLRRHLHARGQPLKQARSGNRERALIIMAKAARVGHVKTRLAASLTA